MNDPHLSILAAITSAEVCQTRLAEALAAAPESIRLELLFAKQDTDRALSQLHNAERKLLRMEPVPPEPLQDREALYKAAREALSPERLEGNLTAFNRAYHETHRP